MSTEKSQEFLQYMSRHLVALTAEYKSYKDGKLFHHGVLAFSGFVVEMANRWFWVTAGHCLKRLDENIPAGTIELLATEFMDCFGPGNPNRNGLPFHYEPGCGFYLEDESLALDFGLIELSSLFRDNMVANGVTAIDHAHWNANIELSFSEYRMLGFPAHEKEEDLDASGGAIAAIRPVMIAIDRITSDDLSNPPDGAWFIGRIPDEVPIPSVEGMSGGPIFGLLKDDNGQWKYRVIALQSWWRPESRVIFGCSLPLFEKKVQSALEDGASAQFGQSQE